MVNLAQKIDLNGAVLYGEALDRAAQEALVADLREIVRQAPLYAPETPRGQKMSVRMTAAGQFGWVTDRRGYRYEARHPAGMAWPAIPESLLGIWRAVAPEARLPECALLNFYGEGARMGLHQDKDEADFSQPVVSVSLGDAGLFRIGGAERGGKTASHWLSSGALLVLGDTARLAYHGVDKIRFGSSSLLPAGGRINVTMRVVS